MSPVFNKNEYKITIKHCPWKLPQLFFRDVKSCFQRIKRGYSDDDASDFSSWFSDVIPDMLDSISYEEGTEDENFFANDEEYLKDLNRMAFLFRETSVKSCSRKNPLSCEHAHILKEFTAKYGNKGEKLMTEEEKQAESTVIHYPSELDEYRKTEEKFIDECIRLARYQETCKNEAFELLSEFFYLL